MQEKEVFYKPIKTLEIKDRKDKRKLIMISLFIAFTIGLIIGMIIVGVMS